MPDDNQRAAELGIRPLPQERNEPVQVMVERPLAQSTIFCIERRRSLAAQFRNLADELSRLWVSHQL